MSRKGIIPLRCLGPKARSQILAMKGRHPVTGSIVNKFHVSAKDQRTLDGIVFDSKLEMNAYRMLRDYRVKFERQVEFTIQESFDHNGHKIRPIKYVADFKVYDRDGDPFIIDTKGMATRECLLKIKLMLAQGHEVHLIKTLGELSRFLAGHGCFPVHLAA